MSRATFLAHRATIALMAIGVLVATGDGFAQSYAGLYRWAIEHHLTEWKAESFPLLVDLFVAVGELGLFALALEGHRLGRRGMAWADLALPLGIATAGWGVSLVFNVGAVGHHFADQATAAVPPVASMLGLLVLLRTLHRLVTRPTENAEDLGPVPAVAAHAYLDAGAAPVDAVPDVLEGAAAALPWWPVPELDAVPLPGPRPVDRAAEDDDQALEDDLEGDAKVGVPDVPAAVLAQAREVFAEDLRCGQVPGVRPIREALRCGQPRAQLVRDYLAVLAEK